MGQYRTDDKAMRTIWEIPDDAWPMILFKT